jgi:hypothetical protein
MYTDDSWFSLHFVQSINLAMSYLKEIRNWMNKNEKEIVVIWLSKHGNVCATGNNQYPDVSNKSKQDFWRQIEKVNQQFVMIIIILKDVF